MPVIPVPRDSAAAVPGAGSDDPALATALFRLVAGGAPWGIVVRGRDGELLAMNRTLVELFGLRDDETAAIRALGRTSEAVAAFVAAGAARTADADAWRCMVLHGEPCAVAEEIPLSDGRVLERYCIGGDGSVAIATFYRDVSERRRAEAELRARARQQAALADLAELAMNAEELEPLLHAVCATAVEVLAVDAAAVFEGVDGRTVVLAGAGIARGPVDSGASLRAALGFPIAAEVRLLGREGGVLGAYARSARVFSRDELRFLETAASILASALARRRAEEEVLEREREARAVFEAALDAIVIFDDAGVIRDANAAASALLGASRAALLGRSVDALAPAARDRPSPGTTGASPLREAEVSGPDGRAHPVELAVVRGIHPGRNLALMRDVAERKRLHGRLALADRMVSVGTLAAGIAHELNNPLACVNSNLAFTAERLGRVGELLAGGPGLSPEDADLTVQLAEATRDAQSGAERMRVLIRNLMTFSRGDDEMTGAVDLRAVIESCVSSAWSEIRHRARLVKDLPELPPVHGNEARLGQVFLNVLLNAAQSIRDGGMEENEIAVVARRDGARVVVEIRDTGSGIAPEHLSRVFDPFFTTRAPGEGTGLGLSICHHVVTGLGGEIAVERAPRGTVLRVALPLAEPPVRPAVPVPVAVPTPAPAAAAPASAHGRISP